MVERPKQHQKPCTLHRTHPTSVAFFDETGAIASDRFFTVGMLRVADHSSLLKQVKSLRKYHAFSDEFKWSEITQANKAAYKDLVKLLLGSDAMFSCFVADRHVADPVVRFGDTFAAYEKLAIQLKIGSILPYELVSVVADNYSAPNHRSFENAVKKECNRRLGRLGVVSVVQVDSAATEGLQLVDVLTGAVGFDFRANAGQAGRATHKAEVSQHLLKNLAGASFNGGFESPAFKVKIYEHKDWLLREQARVRGTAATDHVKRGGPAHGARRKRRGGKGRRRG